MKKKKKLIRRKPAKKITKSLYEGHITCDVKSQSDRVWLDRFGRSNRWSTSWIMNDPMLGSKDYFYFTRYSSSLRGLKKAMTNFITYIPAKVVRMKVEKIVYDKRLT